MTIPHDGDPDVTARVESETPLTIRQKTPVVQFAPGTIIGGRYRIASILGSGGMGEVYRADDIKLDQTVALKFLPARLARDPILLGRLHDEVRMGRQVAHPNVCHIYDIVDADGAHFVSMEYVDGEDLSRLLRRIGRLAHDKAVDIARGIAAGLMAAHAKGILHRDLKPANIMVDARGESRIMDFGLALAAGEDDGTISGTPAYMAPEQLDGEPATVQSDLYALGLVMYELFTGKRTHSARTMGERVRDLNSEITSPSSVIRDIDPAVERVILRCLSTDPALRPKSAREVIASLPGGDPLAAAMAAGETPSPRIVAAAGSEGSLKPWQGWCLMAAVILLLGLIIVSKRSFGMGQYAGFVKSPEVLTEQAASILRTLGIPRQPFSAHEFTAQRNYLGWISSNVKPPGKWKRLRRGFAPMTFTLYQTSEPLTPGAPREVEKPGWTRTDIDREGRLVYLIAQPRRDAAARPLTWNALLSAAGLDPQKLTTTRPRLLPPSAIDAHVAWDGAHPDDGTPIHVEAAAWRGHPVFFRISGAWESATMDHIPFERPAITVFFIGLVSSVLVIGVVFAWRNSRAGRGDRAGALRVAAFMLVTDLCFRLLSADHQPSGFHEVRLLQRSVADALLWAAVLFILYLALEPFVRRRWPSVLIASTRLLSGHGNDPMVGRDVLIGTVAGLAHSGFIAASFWLTPAGEFSPPVMGELRALQGLRFALGFLADAISTAALHGFVLIVVLVTFMVILRRRLLAAIGLGLVMMIGYYMAIGSVVVSTTLITAMLVFVAARYGLLATAVAQSAFMLSFTFPFFASSDRWELASLFPVALLLAFSIWAFRTSLGGQSAFSSALLDD